MKMVILAVVLYAAFVTSTYADAKREHCLNTANTLHYFATERDQGVSSRELTRRATTAHNAGSFNDAQYTAVLALLGMIYSEYKDDSPAQIQRLWLKRCKY